jgi:hypothetical protein
VRLFKAHIVAGGRLDVVNVDTQRSILELVADRSRLIALDVLEFLLHHGAPIVLIDARGCTHDGFVALMTICVVSGAPHRVALLRRLLIAGYEPSPSVLLDGVLRARDDAELHTFFCDLLANVHAPIAPPPLHFAQGANCEALMRELDRVPYVQSDSALMVLFERLLHEADLWSHGAAEALLVRLFVALPDGVGACALRSRLTEKKPVHCGALVALLPRLAIDDDETAHALFTAILQPQWINGSVVDAKLVTIACVCTAGSGAPKKMPLLAMAAAVPTLPDEALRVLLANGFDPNQRSPSDGRTPLHCSATLAHHRVLVAAGADRTVRDNTGKTAFDIALEANRIEESFFLLKEAGGDEQREVVLFTMEAAPDAAASSTTTTTTTAAAAAIVDDLIDVDVPLMVKRNDVAALADLCLRTTSEQRMASLLADGVLSVLMGCLVPHSRDLVCALKAINAIGALSITLRDRVLGAGAAVRIMDIVTRSTMNRDENLTQAVRHLANTLAAGTPPPAPAQSELLTATLSVCSD